MTRSLYPRHTLGAPAGGQGTGGWAQAKHLVSPASRIQPPSPGRLRRPRPRRRLEMSSPAGKTKMMRSHVRRISPRRRWEMRVRPALPRPTGARVGDGDRHADAGDGRDQPRLLAQAGSCHWSARRLPRRPQGSQRWRQLRALLPRRRSRTAHPSRQSRVAVGRSPQPRPGPATPLRPVLILIRRFLRPRTVRAGLARPTDVLDGPPFRRAAVLASARRQGEAGACSSASANRNRSRDTALRGPGESPRRTRHVQP